MTFLLCQCILPFLLNYLMGALLALLFPCPHDAVIHHRSLLCYVCVLLSSDSLYNISCPDFYVLYITPDSLSLLFSVFFVQCLIGVLVFMALIWLFRWFNCKLLSPSEVNCLFGVHISWLWSIVAYYIVLLILLYRLSLGTHVKVACSRTPRCQFDVVIRCRICWAIFIQRMHILALYLLSIHISYTLYISFLFLYSLLLL